jgi:dTDP-4-amino-4,6-dideoxygalactose transaminase
MEDVIPYNLPTIEDEEISEVVATLRSGWLTTGSKTAQFESEFKAYVGAPYALAVNSATAGLHLALTALNIGPGDEVITTPLTFCSTVSTILHTGGTPVLADVGADGNIDPESILERITSRTRAILPVHLGGLPCDMAGIWAIAQRHGLLVVEDAAHAVGSHFQGAPIGAGASAEARSDAVAYSFYATKNLTTGEGGMVTSHEPGLDRRMRVLCLHGISKDAWGRYAERGNWYYDVSACGFKYNLSDIQSAIGIHQLRKQERFIDIRTRHAALYDEEFANVPEVERPPNSKSCRHSWHLYALRLNLDTLTISRAQFIDELKKRNISTSVHFIPIPLLKFFAEHARLPHNHCPVALELYPRLVSLPLYPRMNLRQILYVTESVKEIVQAAKKTTQFSVPALPQASAAGAAMIDAASQATVAQAMTTRQ